MVKQFLTASCADAQNLDFFYVTATVHVASLILQVVHSLENLITDIQEAPESLLVLTSQVGAFSNALENIQQAENKYIVSITKVDRLSRQLGNAVGGGLVIIRQLLTDMLEIRSAEPRWREKKGRKSKMSLRDRLISKWNDEHINKWKHCASPSCYSTFVAS